MSDFFPLRCEFCDENFGHDNIGLALHIAEKHDTRPSDKTHSVMDEGGE